MQKQWRCINPSKAVLWQHSEQVKANPRVQIQYSLPGLNIQCILSRPQCYSNCCNSYMKFILIIYTTWGGWCRRFGCSDTMVTEENTFLWFILLAWTWKIDKANKVLFYILTILLQQTELLWSCVLQLHSMSLFI